MRRFPVLVMALLSGAVGILHAQTSDWFLSAAFRGSYTTTSKVFYNPESPTPEVRNEHNIFDNIYGGGVEVRLQNLADNYFFALTVEYLSKLHEQAQLVALSNPPRTLPVTDGFHIVPIELGLNMFIPLGSEKVRLAMGGGLGAYIGNRIFSVAGVDARQLKRAIGYGIHVESSFDYRVNASFSVRGEMRFRDPEILTESRFDQSTVEYNGTIVAFPRDPFKSRINVNGLTFSLGLVLDIF